MLSSTQNKRRHGSIKAALLFGSSFSMLMASSAMAQSAPVDEIIATGIRQSLENALIQKRNADSLIEVIQAEDIGKLPDQNLAEVLENITGVQITRTAGVGTGVQIRGSNSNRVEINGVSSVGSGSGRNGISFEDVNPAIISSVEVTKAPEAKTIEGSVGGTVNLKTIRPLALKDTLINVRIQGEDNNLSTEGITPRLSGALGQKWDTGGGEIGVVITGSYTEQEAVSFRPRTDRDNLASAPGASVAEYQGIQFFVQEQENDDYETLNLAGTVEWAPSENLKLHADVIINDQERSRDQYRLQASGISGLRNLAVNAPSAFETLDYSAIGGPVRQGALAGLVEPQIDAVGTINSSDGNLRTSSETNSRVTDTQTFSFGGEWTNDRLTVSAEFATSKSDTETPNLSTTMNFLNPNAPLVTEVRFRNRQDFDINGATGSDDRYYFALSPAQRALVGADINNLNAVNAEFQAQALAFTTGDGNVRSVTLLNDNATPFIYDLSGDSLAFGINFDSQFAPTREQLLDPANYVLDQVAVDRNTTQNKEDAVRFDVSYDLDERFDWLTSIDAGVRYNKSSHEFVDIGDRIGGFSNLRDSPFGSAFANLLVPGPDNYGDADGRSLFISDFLLLDPNASFTDPDGTLAAIESAVAAHDAGPDVLNLREDQNAFRDISEKTTAFYGQANFEAGIFKGNVGLRYIETDVDSTGYAPSVNGADRVLDTTSGSYSFVLPRFNVAATPSEDIVLRFGYNKDIRRPGFNNLRTGFSFDTSENAAVGFGNPGLEPEEISSIDLSADWYFAPAAVFSAGYFTKDRTNIFSSDFEAALLIPDGDDFLRETDPSCPGGGTFNPEVIPNVLGDPGSPGLCVDFTIPSNDAATTTQSGFEFAFQGDLSSFEDRLGWASGFGVAANYTTQKFSGGSAEDTTSGRGLTVLGPLSVPRGLLDFSKNAYNITGYYEKYGLSARARYTWREGFRTQDFGGGANTSGSSTLSLPVHTLDRGQLNASINYDVTENFNVGVEAVNLTKSRIIQKCGTEEGPTCFVGYPDRRIVFGGSYTF